MKINLNQPFKDLDGNPVKDQKGELLMSKQLGNLIFQSQDKEDPLRSYELAKKIYYCEGEIEFTTSELSLMKSKIKEGFYAGFAGQLLEVMEGSNSDPKPIGGGGGSGSPRPPKKQ